MRGLPAWVAIATALAPAAGAQVVTGPARPVSSSPVTVVDLIGMTLLGSAPHNSAGDDAHELSPDGAHLAAVLQRGNLERNTLEYALVVFATADSRRDPRPDTLATFFSSGNEPAISHVRWLSDNRSVVFRGGSAGQPAQVYTVDIATHTLTARTHSLTGITSFEIAPAAEPVIYQEHGTIDTSRSASMRAHGFVLSPKVWLSDAMVGDWLPGKARREMLAPSGYRIARGGIDAPLTLPDSGAGFKSCGLNRWVGAPLSPRGDAVMLVCTPRSLPAFWNHYRNPRYRLFADKFGAHGEQLVLLDLATMQARLVSTMPILAQAESPFVWAPDGRSVLVSNALLPLAGPDSALRETQRMAAEIDLRTGEIAIVAPRDSLVVQSWDAHTGLVDFARAFASFSVTTATSHVFYRKTARGWKEVPAAEAAAHARPLYIVDQAPNTPPRLAVVDPKTQTPRVLFDPNPGFLSVHRFGRVEVVHWTTQRGNGFAGGLYYPPDYTPGRRYPLVIQTHGFDSTTFAPDGAFTTDEAAQPLAGAGILVLQAAEQAAGDRTGATESPEEGPFDQDMLEGAIDALDRRGLIDRAKLGMQGFSRSCFSTVYFLTHSSYSIAAASLADGVDYGYLQYLTFFSIDRGSSERINGGLPWGATQRLWLERASGFRLDRVTAALRVTAIGWPGSLLEEWEPYVGLLAQGKPAELVYIPDGSHVLVKPWERLTSQQGVVDWYRFWLQGYEDPDVTKVEQYARWHTLRAQRDSATLSTSR